MISFLDFLGDLANPALAFLPKALFVGVFSAVICALVGTHVVLRGMAFIGDAVSHAVFPGIAVAFVLQGSLLAGGAVAGLVIAVAIALFSQNRHVKEDSIIGILFAGSFALGLIIVSRVAGYSGSLQSFLFGSITGIPNRDIVWVAIAGVAIMGVLWFFHKELVAVSLDRESAAAVGLPLVALDVVLYLTVAGAVVVSVQIIGNVLVLALLVGPAATARLLTNKLPVMMGLAALIGANAAFWGLYLAWALDLPVGATIVLVCTVLFVGAWLFSWRGRLPSRRVSGSQLQG